MSNEASSSATIPPHSSAEHVSSGTEQEPSVIEQADSKLNPMQVVGSVFAAGLGVQSSRNRERDFKQGRAGVFIAAGIVFTALFVATVYTVVSIVLSGR